MPIPTPVPQSKLALRGDLLDFTAAPAWGQLDSPAVRYQPDHWLLIDAQGRIAGVQREEPDASWLKQDHRGRLILPGFIDTHVHAPQLDVIASYGAELLDWLNTYPVPAEQR
jgi:guanine deaminase